MGLRCLWCAVRSLRAGRRWLAAGAGAALLLQAALFLALVGAWFAYGVAHTGKTPETDLTLLLGTAVPYFLLSLGLWFVVGRLSARLPVPNR